MSRTPYTSDGLVTRYGWPERLIVADSGTENSSRSSANPRADLPARPTGAAEYSRRRSATIPQATVLADPISADPRNWLTARANRGHPFSETWPYEHMWLSRVLVPVPTWQWGRLWRAGQSVLCLAMPVPVTRGAGVRAQLLFSPGPGDIRPLPDGVREGGTLRFLTPLPNTASVVSAELTGETDADGPMYRRLWSSIRSDAPLPRAAAPLPKTRSRTREPGRASVPRHRRSARVLALAVTPATRSG